MAARSCRPGKYSKGIPGDLSENRPSICSKNPLNYVSNEESSLPTTSPSRAYRHSETFHELTTRCENVDKDQQSNKEADLNSDETFACSYCQFTVDSVSEMWRHLEVQHSVRRDEN